MKRRIGLGVCALATAAAATAVSVAQAGFSGNICPLLTVKQVSNVDVTPLKCTSKLIMKTPKMSFYSGYWGSSPAAPKYLLIMIYKEPPAMLTVTTRKMRQRRGWVGTPSRVPGVGSVAYQARDGDIGQFQFVSGPYFVGLTLHSPTLLRSPASLAALAKVIATRL